jgi:hypothetical protein
MKKFTLAVFTALLMIVSVDAQTYSTGNVAFFGGYSGKIDVESDMVTLTLIGPSTSWLGLGFNASSMDDTGMDVVIFDGTNVTDRTLNGIGVVPPLDTTQNWTVSSNTIVSGERTVIATRLRDTGDVNDYAFPFSPQSLALVYAQRLGSTAIGYHGSGNCGATMVNFTLGANDYALSKFKMYPNPSINYTLIELPNGFNEAQVLVYDFLGRIVKKEIISASQNRVDTSNLQKGSYMIKVNVEDGIATKILVVN